MSKLVTDVAIDLANHYKRPICLIPSRRQVDSSKLGGGYVEGWTTSGFAEYVRGRDSGQYVFLSRDHSGPWQGLRTADEAQSSLPLALDEAKESLEDDIESGFDLLHIDPSLMLDKGYSEGEVIEVAVELVAFCVNKFRQPNQCAFEVGTDEQDLAPEEISRMEHQVTGLMTKLEHYGLPRPLFYVAQTGTKVMETRNVGSFDQMVPLKGSLPPTVHLPIVLDLLSKHGLMLKEHNADYLSNDSLAWHRKFGIHAANVAPEFGVRESQALIATLEELEMTIELEQLERLVLEGGKYEKWLFASSVATDRKKVEIAAHYHYSSPELIEIREKLEKAAIGRGFSAEKRIRGVVKQSIERYLLNFGYRG